MTELNRALLIGIAGPSGSGKSLLSQRLRDGLGADHVSVICEDAYYHHSPELTFAERCARNYDHPSAFEHDLLLAHLQTLRSGASVAQPCYDFSTHLRGDQTVEVLPRPVIIVEGILILSDPSLMQCFDLKVFVDAPADLCLSRRIRRDTQERGRTLGSVLEQYERSVRPMYLRYIAPARDLADVVIPHGGASDEARDLLMGFARCRRPEVG